jgi:hypothetical protein
MTIVATRTVYLCGYGLAFSLLANIQLYLSICEETAGSLIYIAACPKKTEA